MRFKALLIALAIFALSACTQRTCPTYAESDIEQPSELSK